jgi:DnaJ-domain-containing protein 1
MPETGVFYFRRTSKIIGEHAMRIAFQPELRPALPTVYGCKDYREFRGTLDEMERILTVTGLESGMICKKVAALGADLSEKQKQRHWRTCRMALRYSILLALTGESFRDLSRRVADSVLFQWFTHTSQVDAVRPVSKSTIERFEKMFSREEISALIHDANRAVSDEAKAQELLYRETAIRFDAIFADTTCVKGNIHFPVDWVLLRDAARTLIKAIILIRAHGLKHRIGEPSAFIREMNKLCIEMTHTRKKPNAKKARKTIFRRMKRLMKVIEKHADNYHSILEERWNETDWSALEAQVVLDRMQNILDQLPQAIQQAHERIIGERRVNNRDKILNLYESDLHVLVRGKAGAEVEFGNALYLAEQSDGLIVDWNFIEEQPPGDNKLTKDSIERITQEYQAPSSYTGDRGFDSPKNRIDLEALSIVNAICPRSMPQLKEKLKDEEFCRLQKRRGGTEARIGIFKNAYLGTPLRSKGFKNRRTRIEWCILAHNLWKLARMAAQRREEIEAERLVA